MLTPVGPSWLWGTPPDTDLLYSSLWGHSVSQSGSNALGHKEWAGRIPPGSSTQSDIVHPLGYWAWKNWSY